MTLKMNMILGFAALSLSAATSLSVNACNEDNHHEYSKAAKDCASKAAQTSTILDALDIDKAQHTSECAYNIYWNNTWGVAYDLVTYNRSIDIVAPLSMPDQQSYYYYYYNPTPPTGNVGSLAHIFAERQDVPMMLAFEDGLKKSQEKFAEKGSYSSRDDMRKAFWTQALSVKNKFQNSFLNVAAEKNNVLFAKVCLLLGMPASELSAPLGPLKNTTLHSSAAANTVDFFKFAADLLKENSLLDDALKMKTSEGDGFTPAELADKDKSYAVMGYISTLSA
ncbi:hypothetical protein [Candidatus Finniella inopinata]|uniref:Uncharacterized protein n=1 Tax=Candidatus Finniella inopinata TaxID=1696036 RepID=A0A4Q7DLU0_9PROT|nr:hypothetical protein [Candidatus Finniella inopinata]RZI45726.1 hypothetical protein EQU50_06395 [Candidatus Finniella inopinata]